jgi:hypothetical protein
MDDETTPARARGRAQGILGGLVIGIAGLLAGALAFGGSLASADPPAWTPVELEAGFATFPPEAPLYAAEYHLDDDGFVHVRGGVLADDVEMGKLAVAGDGGGPWVAAAFTLPCGVRPEKNVPLTVVGNEVSSGLVAFHAVAMVQPDGQVMVGGFDIPLRQGSGGEPRATFVVTFDGGTFAADNDEVCPEPTTTTTTTTEPETTTTLEP